MFDRKTDYIGVRIPQDLRLALMDLLEASEESLSEFVRVALKKELANRLNDPKILEDYIRQLELNLKDIELDIQNVNSKLIDLEKEYQNRKAKLEIQKQRLQLQKSQIERQIQQLKQKIEEIKRKREQEKKSLRITDKVINIVKSVFCADEPVDEEVEQIVKAVGRLNIREVLEKSETLRQAKVAFGLKINELTEFIQPFFDGIDYKVVRGLAFMFVEDVKLLKYNLDSERDCIAEARAWLIKHGADEYALDKGHLG